MIHLANTQSGAQTDPNDNLKTSTSKPVAVNPLLPVINCQLSNWSRWSTCSALCGRGKRVSSRFIIQMPQNGGTPCDKKLTRTQQCKDLPPCPPISASSNTSGIHHRQGKNHQHHYGLTLRTTTTSTTTSTQASSMVDDEDDSKFSKLIRSDPSRLHLFAPSWLPTESSYYFDAGYNRANLDSDKNHQLMANSNNNQLERNGILYSMLRASNVSDLDLSNNQLLGRL